MRKIECDRCGCGLSDDPGAYRVRVKMDIHRGDWKEAVKERYDFCYDCSIPTVKAMSRVARGKVDVVEHMDPVLEEVDIFALIELDAQIVQEELSGD